MQNEKDIDLQLCYSIVNENKLKIYDGWNPKNLGEILINMGGQYIYAAEDWIKKAIKEDKNNVMMWCLGRDYVLYSELYRRNEKQQKSKEKLCKAIDIFRECGANGWVKKYEKELAEL